MKIGTLDINNLCVGGSQASAAYLGSVLVYPSQPTGQPNNEIWYTSTDSQVVTPFNTSGFGANIVSNTYSGGEGVIRFDNDITVISNSSFSGCTTLQTVELPDTIASIGMFAFLKCTSLSSIEIPDSVTSIGRDAFSNCTNLSSVTLGSGVTVFNSYIFANDTSLSSITIPDNVTEIGANMFNGCTSLSTINYTGTKSQWEQVTKGYGWNLNVPATVVHCTDGDVII